MVPLTVVLKVTSWPKTEGLTDEPAVVADAALFTVIFALVFAESVAAASVDVTV
jgi:hypothetical protein